MDLSTAKPADESKTYRQATYSQIIGWAVTLCGAVGGVQIFGAHPLDQLMPETMSRRVQAGCALVAAVGGSFVVSTSGKAKDGRLEATQPVYHPHHADLEETQAVSLTVRDAGERSRLAAVTPFVSGEKSLHEVMQNIDKPYRG